MVAAFVAVAMSVVPASVGPTVGSPAWAAEGPLTPLVEDYGYPGAEEILTEQGIELISGDGNLVLVDCPASPPGGVVWVASYEAGPDQEFCFEVRRPVAYLALEIPRTYFLRGDGVHDVTATVSVDGETTSVPIARDSWTPVGTSSPEHAALLELVASPADGSGVRVLRSRAGMPFLARIHTGPVGHLGSRACTGSVVSPEWVLTAASCFAEDPADPVLEAGPPAEAAEVRFGGHSPVAISELVPRSDRDLVLARLAAPLPEVTAAQLAGSVPSDGLSVVGYGRTAGVWSGEVPDVAGLQAVEATGTAIAATVGDGVVCLGSAGGPVVNGEGRVVGVASQAGQQGCAGVAGGGVDVAAARVDDIFTWINDHIWESHGATIGDPSSVVSVVGDFVGGDEGEEVFQYRPGVGADYLVDCVKSGGVASCERHGFSVNGLFVPLVGDFDGSGDDEIFWYGPGGAPDVLWDFTDAGSFVQHEMQVSGLYRPVAGDLNGDGWDDVLWYAPGAAADSIWTFGGAAGEFSYTCCRDINITGDYTPLVGFFGDDAAEDVVLYGRGAVADHLFDFQPGDAPSYVQSGFGPINGSDHQPFTLDRGGDGWTDIFWYNPGPTNDVYWEYSAGGLVKHDETVDGDYSVATGDLFGDGHEDIWWGGDDLTHLRDYHTDTNGDLTHTTHNINHPAN